MFKDQPTDQDSSCRNLEILYIVLLWLCQQSWSCICLDLKASMIRHVQDSEELTNINWYLLHVTCVAQSVYPTICDNYDEVTMSQYCEYRVLCIVLPGVLQPSHEILCVVCLSDTDHSV